MILFFVWYSIWMKPLPPQQPQPQQKGQHYSASSPLVLSVHSLFAQRQLPRTEEAQARSDFFISLLPHHQTWNYCNNCLFCANIPRRSSRLETFNCSRIPWNLNLNSQCNWPERVAICQSILINFKRKDILQNNNVWMMHTEERGCEQWGWCDVPCYTLLQVVGQVLLVTLCDGRVLAPLTTLVMNQDLDIRMSHHPCYKLLAKSSL